MKKKTLEEFIKEANIVHNFKYDYSKVNYINQRTCIDIICPIHGSFNQTPKNHLKGQGCPICGKLFAKQYHKGQYNKFIEEVNKRYGDVYEFPFIANEYENNKSKITYKCKKCGFSNTVEANYFITSFNGCPNCSKIENHIEKYTKNDIETLLFGSQYELVSVTTDKLNGFILPSDIITIKCKIHGEVKVKCETFIKHKDDKLFCKHCHCSNLQKDRFSKKYITKEEFISIEKDKFGNKFSYNIDEFIDEKTKMTFICNDCGFQFKRSPRAHLKFTLSDRKTGCKNCSTKKFAKERTKTIEEFKQDVIKLYGVDAFDFEKTEYNGSTNPVTIKCNECGKYFTIEANSLLQGHGCPRHYRNHSKCEEEILTYLQNDLRLKCETNNREVLNGQEIDIYIPSLKLGVEYNGLYWHNELNKTDKNYHLNKTKICEANNVRLIQIFEDEWLYKKDIVKSMLKNIANKNSSQKIYARSCTIKVVDGSIAKNFIDNNHIQGYAPSKINIGLYNNNKLVSLMSFGHSRHFIGDGKSDWELIRFCSLNGINVIGGASRLLHFFIKENRPKKIITFADKRWSVGNLYNKLGFKLYNESKPNYFYIIGDKRKYRYNFRKSVLVKKYGCPQEMSEHQFCLSKKWYRIYDCGNYCYKIEF